MYIDLLVTREPLPSLVNVVHPRPTTWEEILAGINEELGGSIPFVSPEIWVAKLDKLSPEASGNDLQRIVSVSAITPTICT